MLDRVAHSILDIIPLVMRVMAAEIRASGRALSSAHTPLLGMLQYRPYTLSDLAERNSVSAPTMSNTVTAMEERGWVSRRRSESDRRVVWIEITEEGRAALEDIQNHVAKRISGLLSDLTPDEQEQLAVGLRLLRDSFAAALERDPQLGND